MTDDQKIRVFHLIKSLGRGGAEMLLPEGLHYADRTKFEFKYGYMLPWTNDMVESLKRQDVDVICFHTKTTVSIMASAFRIARELRYWKADVMHCHLPVSGIVGRLAGKLAGVPVVYTEHNKMERYHPLTRKINIYTWKLQKHVIAVSNEVKESIGKHAPASVPVRVVLNGVNGNHFSREALNGNTARDELNIPQGVPVIGTVASFRVQKQLDLWLKIASMIRNEIPSVKFLLVGDGPVRDSLHKQVRELNLGDAVYFPGLQKDVRPYLATMDIYLMTSRFEGLPVALLEAMAMERPVVSTPVGGIPEVIEEGRNGYLIPDTDLDRFRKKLSELLNDDKGRLEMGKHARETVMKNFGMERMQKELEEIYVQIHNAHESVTVL